MGASGLAVWYSMRPKILFCNPKAAFPTLTRYSMRAWTCLLGIVAAGMVGATSDQQVLQRHAASDPQPAQRVLGNTNSTGNLIFSSVNSLLQFWLNTRYINGTVTP